MGFLKVFGIFVLSVVLLFALTTAADSTEDQPTERVLCPCPRNFDPVCASNQITYSNRCEYDCVRREVERRGRSLSLLRSGQC